MANCSEILTNRLNLTVTQNLSVFVMITIIACLTVIINLVLAVTLWKTKQLNVSTNVYIFLLSLSDCMQGALAMPLIATGYRTYRNQEKCRLFIIAQAFSSFYTHLSGYIILLIAFDRYMYVLLDVTEHNGCFRKLKSKHGLIILRSFCFFWSITAGGFTVIENELAIRLPTICLGIVDMLAMAIIYILYIRMYIKVWRHSKASVVYNKEFNRRQQVVKYSKDEVQQKRKNTPRYTREVAKTIVIIMIAIAVCYLPATILHAYVAGIARGPISNTVQFSYHLSFPVLYLNPILNACIILYRNTRLQEYLRNKISWTLTSARQLTRQQVRNSTDDE